MSDPVLIYDSKPVEEYRPLKKRQPMPSAPLSRAVSRWTTALCAAWQPQRRASQCVAQAREAPAAVAPVDARCALPATPLQAAQAALQESADAKKRASKEGADEEGDGM